jgi:hypothetical protein
MRTRLVKALRTLLHANVYSLALFALLFALLWAVGVGVPLSLILAKVTSWAAFAGQLGLAALRR